MPHLAPIHSYLSSARFRWVVGTAMLYFVFGHASFGAMVSHGIVTPVFFVPEGIALAAAMLFGSRIWPGIFIGQAALALSRGLDITPALAIAAINSAEAILASRIVRHWKIDPRLERIGDLARLLIIILGVLQPFSATLGCTTLYLSGVIVEAAQVPQAWLNWWVGNSLGQAQIAPLLLVAYHKRNALREELCRVALPLAMLLPAGWLAFAGQPGSGITQAVIIFAPLLCWIGDRGGLATVSLANSAMACLAIALAGNNLGPFVEHGKLSMLDLNVFIFGVAATSQFYSLLARERRELQERLEKMNAHLPGMIYQYQRWPDGRSGFPYISQGIAQLYQVDPKEVARDASPLFSAVHPEDRAQIDASVLASEASLGMWQARYRVIRKNGETRWLEGQSIPERQSDGSTLWHGFILDITERKLAEDQLRITARIFDRAGDAIAVTDARGRIQTVNGAFERITGYTPGEAIGKTTALLKSGRHSEQFYEKMWQDLQEKGFWQDEIWNKRKNGEIYPEWLTINRVDTPDGGTEHYVAVFSDISEIKDNQRKAQYLATHDALTGLPNRTLFQDRLGQSLAQSRRTNEQVALLFIDLDNFKTINDTLGHDIGDALLNKAAERLRGAVRDFDTVARLGGDEFTAILGNAGEQVANQVARRILADLSSTFEIGEHVLFVSASIGIAFFPQDGDDPTALTKAADAAMYRAKELGRNRIECFKQTMQEHLLRRTAIENALREGIRRQRFKLVYQPKYRISGGDIRLVGAETLLRWTDPLLGDVSPAEFIPIAESSGLILDISNIVVGILLNQIATWQSNGLPVPTIAFNVSPRCIREPGFARQLVNGIAASGVVCSLLQIEITEGALLENSGHVVDNLAELNTAGLRIAIDDFGTGYSSLSYLKRLPIDELKIDKSFVDGLGNDKEDEAITRAILGLAKALDLATVAEGVETDRQLAWLAQYGCDIVQGYLLSRPIPPNEFAHLLTQGA